MDLKTQRDLWQLYNSINLLKPVYLSGFVSALSKLEFFMRENNLSFDFKLKLVHPSAENLTENERSAFQKTFGADYVAMVYGSTEGHFASECQYGCMHIEEENCHVYEENNNFFVTIYDTFDLPFVNYQIGDQGLLGRNKCKCGKNGSIIKNISGRTGDIINLGATQFTHADINMLAQQCKVIDQIQCYQLLQTPSQIELRFVGSKNAAQALVMHLSTRLQVEIELSDRSPQVEPSGKIRPIKNQAGVKYSKFVSEYKEYSEISQASIDEFQNIFKLDWNEGFADYAALNENFEVINNLNYYPDLSANGLHTAAALHYGLAKTNLLSFSGSDAAINTVCQTYLDDKSKVMILGPTYGNYNAIATRYTQNVTILNLSPFEELNVPNLIKSINSYQPSLLFMPNPDNPTGRYISISDIDEIIQALPNTMVLLDEAYAEFEKAFQIEINLLRHNNLVITRTLSKAFSLAGLRIGFAIANTGVIGKLRKFRDNKQINSISQYFGKIALENPQYMMDFVGTIVDEKIRLRAELKALNVHAVFGSGNYFLIKTSDPKRFCSYMEENNIFIRDRSDLPLLDGFVRVTIGTREINDGFLKVVKGYHDV